MFSSEGYSSSFDILGGDFEIIKAQILIKKRLIYFSAVFIF